MAILKSTANKNSTAIEYLCSRFTYFSEEVWKTYILEERIKINGKILNSENDSLRIGDTIEIEISDELLKEPPVNPNWNLLYEDESLFIVDKPPDLPVHPAGRYKEHTLLRILERIYPNSRFLPCHRLDRETSGILIFAKNPRAGRILSKQFQTHKIHKEYLVWVYGKFPPELQADGILVKDEDSRVRKKVKFLMNRSELKMDSPIHSDPGFNSSMDSALSIPPTSLVSTELRLEFFSEENGISIVRAIPLTGKTHQIRATVQSLGYPILGDKIYGKDSEAFLKFISSGWDDELQKLLGHNRQALHCHIMEFTHPDSGERKKIISPIPHDLPMFP